MAYCIAIDRDCPWKGSAVECSKHDCPTGKVESVETTEDE